MTRKEAIHFAECLKNNWTINFADMEEFCDMVIETLSVEATKKKAELKENGDWDCPDVDCDECDHHRSVEWCSLAIPNHEEKIDETYKMVNEAFFEGFDAAEKRYRFLIEYVEELDEEKEKSADAVQGEWIRKNYHTYICNQCGYEEAIYGNVEEYRFCSHCGARMIKGGDDE